MTPPRTPYVLVLGTAQDAGVPQIASSSPPSRAARRDPRLRRLAASLLLVDPASARRWLFDATPDLREQVERAEGHPARRDAGGARAPLFEAIFLTHAHVGHYAGLLQLGREAYGAERQRVLGSARMCAFLEGNAPWELLVREEHVVLEPFRADEAIDLGGGLRVTPLEVPHRAEYTDAFGFVVHGPSRALLYVPDIDEWHHLERPIEEILATVDVALLDGTFYAESEIPGRSTAEIPHPFIEESLARFAALPAAERAKIVFTHLNHTNPAADPDGEAAARVRAAGMRIAHEGEILPL